MSETSPPPTEAVIQTAARLLAAGRATEATAMLQQLVGEAPTYAAAHVLLASALDASGRQTEALDAWRRAAFLVPHSPLVHRERQRLADAHLDASAEAPATPVDVPGVWDDGNPERQDETQGAPGDDTEAQLTTIREDSRDIELARPGDDAPPEAFRSTEDIDLSEPEAAEPEAAEAQPMVEPDAEGPIETPLLPPEGTLSSSPQPPIEDLELEDDGWTILEDDEATLDADAAITAVLLPPEPQTTLAPLPVQMPDSESSASSNSELEDLNSSISDDLDDLITQLDSAPRIKPDPTFSGPKVTFNESSMDDVVSETLAKIYAAQHQYVQAAVVYEKLATREPKHADTLLERAAEMRDKAR